MLSIYSNGQTVMRFHNLSKEDCLSAGRSYIVDKTAERFDCGYKCYLINKINLQDSPLCKIVCNDGGCRK